MRETVRMNDTIDIAQIFTGKDFEKSKEITETVLSESLKKDNVMNQDLNICQVFAPEELVSKALDKFFSANKESILKIVKDLITEENKKKGKKTEKEKKQEKTSKEKALEIMKSVPDVKHE